MSLTSAMLVGYTGIKSNTVSVDTVGDNLANLNTTAFKGQRTLFETLLYRTVREGEAPGATSGGTLPLQVGSGSTVAVVQRNFSQGGIEGTGFQSDLAVEGDGFFILADPSAAQLYTRDGSFSLDATQTLVATSGAPVQVFGADADGNIDTSTLTNLVVPLGTASAAIQTTGVVMDGQLDAGTPIAATAAVAMSQLLVTSGGAPATAATPLTDLVDTTGIPLFAGGDELVIGGSKGGISVTGATFVVGTDGSTLGDLAASMEAVFGINTDPAAGGTPGVTIGDGTTAPAGTLIVSSNLGEINAMELDSASITNRTGIIQSPFTFATTTEAVGGGGVTTTFPVFDSLGQGVAVRIRAVLESKTTTGTTWRFYAESAGDTDLSPALGTGTISFDANGQFVSATGTQISIDRNGTGASTPVTLTLDFNGLTGLASTNGRSTLIMSSQDGAQAGVMIGYEIGADGIVTATFSNQQTTVLGQIALAKFRNNEGLLARSENTFVVGPNSGDANIVAPMTEAAGAIRSGALEGSNVEIAREFINLISASTGISSASRVVRVADDLLQELLLLAR
ncbi:MAG: flagellar hook-basal body complex protein [Planctomycetes bacterium]|nr:flagellar hook-basal body complex protein [Planctomycetota bacterium]